ncbi:MAG: molybdopterin-guanine dinucleotide biosynthesis protein B [Magnetococcales bacterium]|nr:molybdopterin-guanine dinucleotide biosynthesis protein B [Magnetococcales bacterium]
MPSSPPVIGFVAPSGSGKTTLIEQVITHLVAAGLRVATIKHGHHPADPDIPGKDTHRFRQAGAHTVLFACPERWFMIQDLHQQPEPTLTEQVARLHGHDIILVEGYKEEEHPKIVLLRRAASDHNLHRTLKQVIAVATDDPESLAELPVLPLNDPGAVAEFIRSWIPARLEELP